MTSVLTPSSLRDAAPPPNTCYPGCSAQHVVQFYDQDDAHCADIASFLIEGWHAGESVTAIVTEAHRIELTERLNRAGVQTGLSSKNGVALLNAEQVLQTFMSGGQPDATLFRASIEGVLRNGERAGTRLYGEMVELLWQRGEPHAALRLEEFWNELAAERSFTLLCAYSMRHFARESNTQQFLEVCRLHGRVVPLKSSYAPGDDSQARELLLLQQRARALQSEASQRRILEDALRTALDDRIRAEENAQRRGAELLSFMDSAVEGMHWIGADGIILWANRAELELMGYQREEYVGHHIAEFHVDQQRIADMMRELTSGNDLRSAEAQMRCRDGSVRDVLIDSSVLWHNGKFVHTQCFMRDITERKKAELALRHARAEAERASRFKSQFLAFMSHELRTPLNGIIGYQDLLDHEVGGPVTSRQREYLQRIRIGAEQLLALIDQVFSLTRIETGEEELDVSLVDVCSLLQNTCALVEPGVASKQLALRVRVPAQPELCHTDAYKLKQILLNLLSNAAKFTDQGRIQLDLRSSADRFVIMVRDTGTGIDSRDLERIFDPFVQIASSGTRRRSGIGLGLPVSRNLARLLGGDLTVQSQPGSGSTFILDLPRRAPGH